MPVRPISAAKPVFEKHVNGLLACVHAAYDRYLDGAGAILSAMETRTKRGMVRDLIVEELRSYADRTSGVHYFRNGNLKWLGFENNWIVRVKHIDDKFAVEPSPTRDSRAYDRNEIPDSIAETLMSSAPATTTYLGWLTTENAPATPQVSLICNNRHAEAAWVWPLSGDGPPPSLHLPVPSIISPTPGSGGTRIVVKESAKPSKQSR